MIHNEAYEAEVSVLGSIMLKNAAMLEVEGLLTPVSFADPRHRLVFEAMQSLAQANTPIDPITVLTELGGKAAAAGGMAYFVELSAASASAEVIRYHAEAVHTASQVRGLAEGLLAVVKRARGGDDDVAGLVDQAAAILQATRQGQNVDGAVDHRELLKIGVTAAEAAYKNPGVVTGVSTGFVAVDSITGGLQKAALVILAARPSMGKTALAMNFALNAAKDGKRSVAFFSLEMPRGELARRVLSSEAMVDGERIRSGHLSEGDVDRLMAAVKRCSAGLPIRWIDRSTITTVACRAECRQIASDPAMPPLGLVVVDYMQLVSSPQSGRNRGRNREQEVSEISRDFKLLAMDLNVPVVVLSQLNRGVEVRANKRPLLADLRESGAIEQDADLVMFVYRDEYYNDTSPDRGQAEVIVAKNRLGSTGTRKLKFAKQWTRFDDLEPDLGQ